MNVITNNNIKCTVALAGLEQVLDPEIGLNVVDLGLIYEINFDETQKKITCNMTLTTTYCPMGASIVEGVKNSIKNSFSEYSIHVNLTYEPEWDYDRISEAGKSFLSK
jgi:metal-sulfur cluster biosynthetic enzyme